MTKRSVISYLYRSEATNNDVIKSEPFDFRIHEDVDVISTESIAKRIFSDRGNVPSDCYVDWY